MILGPKGLVQRVFKTNILDAWRATLEKTSRIILGRDVHIRLVSTNNGMVGWTDGADVFLNRDVVRETLDRVAQEDSRAMAVIGLKGLVYHEDGHILFSPRQGSDIVKWATAKVTETGDYDWWKALNIVEDQRMESMFVAKYSPARRYFTALSLQYLVAHANISTYILVAGRSFVPVEIRAGLRKVFRENYGDSLVREVDAILKDYKRVIFPQDTNKAEVLVRRMKEVLDVVNDPGNVSDHGQYGPVRNLRQEGAFNKGNAGVIAQKAAAKALPDVDDELDELEEAEAQIAGPRGRNGTIDHYKDDEDDAEGGSAGDGGTESGNSAVGRDRNAESFDDGEVEPGSEGGGVGHGQGALKDNPVEDFDINDVLDNAQDLLEDMLDGDEIQRDVKDAMDAMKAVLNRMDGHDAEGEKLRGSQQEVATDMKIGVRKVVDRFRQLRAELEPEWDRGLPSGRLNTGRLARREAKPTELNVFDRWHEGAEEEGSVEAVVLIDLSSSMARVLGTASAGLWIIKRAFDEAQIPVTIIGFSSTHSILFQRKEKASRDTFPVFPSQSSTNPESALKQALKVLASTSANNKLLITITDGAWGWYTRDDETESDKLVKAIKKTGAVTAILGLDGAVHHHGKHNHEIGRDISSPLEVVDVATDIVKGFLARATTFA